MQKFLYVDVLTCDGAKIRRKSTAANGGNVPRLGSTWNDDDSQTTRSISIGCVCLEKSSCV